MANNSFRYSENVSSSLFIRFDPPPRRHVIVPIRRHRPDEAVGGPWAGAHRFFVRHRQSAGQVEPFGAVVGVGELDDGVVAAEADGLVHIAEAEWLGLLAIQFAHDRGGGVHRGGDAALAGAVHDPVTLQDGRRVADGVDVGMRHRTQRLVGDDAATVVDLQARPPRPTATPARPSSTARLRPAPPRRRRGRRRPP